MNKRNIDLIFPTPVSRINLEDTSICDRYADLLLTDIGPEQQKRLLEYGVVPTSDELHLLDEFQSLVKLIDNEITLFFDEALGLDRKSVHMTAMWANIQVDKCRHHVHQHPNSFYSGVLYLRVPTGNIEAGDIFFVDPRPSKNMWTTDYTKDHGLSHRSRRYTPETGLLLLFPSWLEHGTEMFNCNSAEYRVSLSFNYTLIQSNLHTMKLNLKPAQ